MISLSGLYTSEEFNIFLFFITRILEFLSFLLFKYFIGFFFQTTKSLLLATT